MFKPTLLASISWSGQPEKKQVRPNSFVLFGAEMIEVGEEFVVCHDFGSVAKGFTFSEEDEASQNYHRQDKYPRKLC